jgi:hypothetical protein
MPPIETPPPRIGATGALRAEADALGDLPQQQSPRPAIGPPLPRPRPAILAAAKPFQDPQAATVPVAPPKSTPLQSPSATPSNKPSKPSNLPAIND